MPYADRAALKVDATFRGRVDACILNEASVKPSDAFVEAILTRPNYGLEAFLPFVISAPGFDKAQDLISDGDILAVVQATWARVQALVMP